MATMLPVHTTKRAAIALPTRTANAPTVLDLLAFHECALPLASYRMKPLDADVAGRELQHYLTALNAPKHSSRERALKSFKAFAEAQGSEFYDDDIDTWLSGDGSTPGLLAWCGEGSTGTEGGLKRTAATAIKTLGWLVKHSDGSGEEVKDLKHTSHYQEIDAV
jgi:hypothetical protein